MAGPSSSGRQPPAGSLATPFQRPQRSGREDARRDWDTYWRTAGVATALREAGPQDPALERFWCGLLDAALARVGGSRTLLDVGTGAGPVVRFALESAARVAPHASIAVSALDGSFSALHELRERHPEVRCVAADFLHPPFPAQAFDIVTSQFGMEYAGPAAIPAMASLVAAGGMLAAIIHLHDGAIFRECSASLGAIERFRESGLLPRFGDVYRAAWAVKVSSGPVDALREENRRLGLAVRHCEETLRRFGGKVASGLLHRIYQDLRHMHARLGAYEPGEMSAWLGNTEKEVDGYARRMSSMVQAALDEAQIAAATQQLVDAGFRIRALGVLNFERAGAPCAWTLVADRDATA